MASGISYRSILFVAALFFCSCGNGDGTTDKATDTTAQNTMAQDTIKNIKENLAAEQKDTTTLFLTEAKKEELRKDKQMLKQYRIIVANTFPKPYNWVNDYDNIFTQKEEDNMNNLISGFEKETGMQIAVITLDTLSIEKDNISAASVQISNAWGVGTKKKNDGLLIIIAREYGFMRINTGKGTQQILNDQAADSIMRAAFFPSYAKKDFYKGTLTGLNALISYMRPNAGKIK